MFLVNSRLSLFTAALSPLCDAQKLPGHPFFRRYGVNLPSSLTEVRSFTLGEIPRPTGVGVRYGQNSVWLAAFLGDLGSHDFRLLAEARPAGHGAVIWACLDDPLRGGNRSCPFDRLTLPIASPLHSVTTASGAGLSYLLAIAYDLTSSA